MRYAEDFRRIGRNALTGRWALAIGTCFVASLLGFNGGANLSSSSINYENMDSEQKLYMLPVILGITGIALLFSLVAFFLGGPITLGYCRFNKNLLDDTNPQFKDLFSRFDIFWKGFLLQLLMAIFTFLWMLLFIIPGIIAAYSYSMAPYILEENPGMSALDAINASKEMMRGNKFRLFCLEISFIGWGILCLFTCGIGFFWLNPYIFASKTAFFYDVSGKYVASNGASGYDTDQPYQPYQPYQPM